MQRIHCVGLAQERSEIFHKVGLCSRLIYLQIQGKSAKFKFWAREEIMLDSFSLVAEWAFVRCGQNNGKTMRVEENSSNSEATMEWICIFIASTEVLVAFWFHCQFDFAFEIWNVRRSSWFVQKFSKLWEEAIWKANRHKFWFNIGSLGPGIARIWWRHTFSDQRSRLMTMNFVKDVQTKILG